MNNPKDPLDEIEYELVTGSSGQTISDKTKSELLTHYISYDELERLIEDKNNWVTGLDGYTYLDYVKLKAALKKRREAK